MKIKITRFVDEPIIPPFLDQEIGSNINGPSLIRAPNWIAGLGKYYLYFADHKGDNIKLAYSDNLEGPWKILSGGTLKLENSYFLNEKPSIPDDFNVNDLGDRDAHVDLIAHIPTKIDDMTIPHIASPVSYTHLTLPTILLV